MPNETTHADSRAMYKKCEIKVRRDASLALLCSRCPQAPDRRHQSRSGGLALSALLDLACGSCARSHEVRCSFAAARSVPTDQVLACAPFRQQCQQLHRCTLVVDASPRERWQPRQAQRVCLGASMPRQSPREAVARAAANGLDQRSSRWICPAGRDTNDVSLYTDRRGSARRSGMRSPVSYPVGAKLSLIHI